MSRLLFLDTETTGINAGGNIGHRILEVGVVEMKDKQLTGMDFDQRINPQRTIDEGAMGVHGITFDDVEQKPVFAQIVDEFLNYIGNNATVIIHNAPFDVGMINYEFELLNKQGHNYGQLSDYCKIIDSLKLARRLHKGKKNSLDALCDRYKINRQSREYHNALLDCQLLSQVYLRLIGGQRTLFKNEQPKLNLTNVPLHDYSQLELPKAVTNPEELDNHVAFLQSYSKEYATPFKWLQQDYPEQAEQIEQQLAEKKKSDND